jgi:hypothetical protein
MWYQFAGRDGAHVADNGERASADPGHHSAAFTLSTYVHLLDGDLGEPLALGAASTPEDSTRRHPS